MSAHPAAKKPKKAVSGLNPPIAHDPGTVSTHVAWPLPLIRLDVKDGEVEVEDRAEPGPLSSLMKRDGTCGEERMTSRVFADTVGNRRAIRASIALAAKGRATHRHRFRGMTEDFVFMGLGGMRTRVASAQLCEIRRHGRPLGVCLLLEEVDVKCVPADADAFAEAIGTRLMRDCDTHSSWDGIDVRAWRRLLDGYALLATLTRRAIENGRAITVHVSSSTPKGRGGIFVKVGHDTTRHMILTRTKVPWEMACERILLELSGLRGWSSHPTGVGQWRGHVMTRIDRHIAMPATETFEVAGTIASATLAMAQRADANRPGALRSAIADIRAMLAENGADEAARASFEARAAVLAP